jgi:hypothetical protein
MPPLRKRSRARANVPRFLLGVLGLLALAGVAGMAVHGAWSMYGKFTIAAAGADSANQQLSEAQGQYVALTASVGSLSSDRGVAAQMRQRFGVALPGEGEIQIVRDQTPTTTSVAASSGNFFARIFHALVVW